MKKRKKGFILDIGIIVLVVGIALIFIVTTLQNKEFVYRIYTDEVNVMEIRDGLILTEKGMDASWDFASTQALFTTGDNGLGLPYWYALDNTKLINNKNQEAADGLFVKSAKGELTENPQLTDKNPIVFTGSNKAFSVFYEWLLERAYLPSVPLKYYLKGTETVIDGINLKKVSLGQSKLDVIINQTIVSAGKTAEFREDYNSDNSILTNMSTMISSSQKFTNSVKSFVSKTATFGGCGDYCLKTWDTGKTATQLAFDIITAFTDMETELTKAVGEANVEAHIDITTPFLFVPDSTDKIIGNQGGLSIKFDAGVVLVDKGNSYIFDSKDAKYNVKDISKEYGQPVSGSSDIFNKRPVSLQFKAVGVPAVLNCVTNNDKRYSYSFERDLLCMSNQIWSCVTNIQGLADKNKKSDRDTISYGMGDYKCVSMLAERKWCKQGTDTRDEDYCCEFWPDNDIGIFHPNGELYCIGDGSCDNGLYNIDGKGGDRNEKCLGPNGNINADCPCIGGCCDPEESAADKTGCVPTGHIDTGTECSVCMAGGYRDDSSLCSPVYCTYIDVDGFLATGEQQYMCSGGSCEPFGTCS